MQISAVDYKQSRNEEYNMRTNILTVLSLAICVAGPFAPAASEGRFDQGNLMVGNKPVMARKCLVAPQIDGQLNDECWGKITPITNLVWGPEPLQVNRLATKIFVTYDSRNIYIAARCDEPMMDAVKAKSKPGAAVQGDDCVEVFLDVNNDRKTYFHFMANSAGLKQQEFCQAPWAGEWMATASRAKDCWCVEMAIPFKSLKISPPIEDGACWGIHLGRVRYASGKLEYASVVNIPNSWHSPWKFGKLIFGNYLSNIQRDFARLQGQCKDQIDILNERFQAQKGSKPSRRIQDKLTAIKARLVVFHDKLTAESLAANEIGADGWMRLNHGLQLCHGDLTDLQRENLFFDSNFIIWEQNPWKTFIPEALPSNGTTSKVDINTCINEHSTFVLMISANPDKDVSLNIEAGDIKQGYSIFPADQVHVQTVLFLKDRIKQVPVPDPIIKTKTLTIPRGETRQIWCTLDSKGVLPGNYHGPFRFISASTGTSQEVQVNIKVWPIELPSEMPICIAPTCYDNTYFDNHMDSYILDLVEHYANHFFFLNVDGCLNPVFNEKGEMVKLFKKQDYFEKKLNVIKKHAPHGIIWIGPDAFWMVQDKIGPLVFASPDWENAAAIWLKGLVSQLRQMGIGYDRFVLAVADETQGKKAVDKYLKVASLIKKVDPEIKLVCTAGNDTDPDEIKLLNPFNDILEVCHFQVDSNGAQYQTIRSFNKPILEWIAFVDCYPRDVCYQHYLLGFWQVWKEKMSGVGLWAYNAVDGDPWDITDGACADGSVIYPGKDGPVTSRRWEAFRQGAGDYLRLYVLADEIKKCESVSNGKTRKAVETAREVLDKSVEAVLSHPNEPEYSDVYRLKILESIINLRN